MKIQRKFSLFTISLFVLAFLAVPVLAAVPLSDPDDSLRVSSPKPNQFVKGEITTKFTAVDDDRNNVPFELTLRSQNCVTPISVINSGTATSGQEKSIAWSTGGPLQSVSSVADGTYCMEVCTNMKKGNNNYSACNSRYITIRNNNSKPQITTSPPSDRTIYQDESWVYDVNATDAEGDKLTFSLSEAPSFLRIDSYTGKITASSSSKPVGTYTVLVEVVDGFGGSTTQEFKLTVETRPAPPPSSSSSSSATSSESSSSSSSSSETSSTSSINPEDVNVEFIAPKVGDELSGQENEVSWSISGLSGSDILSIQLSLLIDNELMEINTLSPTSTTANLDVSEIEEGEYRLQLDVNTENQSFTQQSEQFKVVPEDGEPDNGEATERPLITNVIPENESTVSELRPVISGEFVAPDGATIDVESFQFFFDEVGWDDWCSEVTEGGFTCTPDTDLDDGVHKVRVAVADDQNRLGASEWTFTVNAGGDETTGENTIELFGMVIPISTLFYVCGACLVLLILILVPWVLFLIWRRRQDDDPQSTTTPPPDGGAPTTASSDFTNVDAAGLTSVTDQYGSTASSASQDSNYVPTDQIGVPDYGLDLDNSFPETVSNEEAIEQAEQSDSTSVPAPAQTPAPSAPQPQEQDSPVPTLTPEPSAAPATATDAGSIDPLQFDNYEDYLAAVGTASAPQTDAAKAVPDTPQVNDPNAINAPDYSDLYTASPSTGQAVDGSATNTQATTGQANENSGTTTAGSDGNGSNTPDWLNPVG